MKQIHLLRVDAGPSAVGELIEALRQEGLRAGWLEYSEPQPLPEDLASAADLGVLRAVAVGSQGSVAIKPRRGQVVLKDLLREHFRGCQVVFVRGDVEAPLLHRENDAWKVSLSSSTGSSGTEISFDEKQLAQRLRRPSPWPI